LDRRGSEGIVGGGNTGPKAMLGVVVSCDTLWRFLKRQGISLKKPCSQPSKIIEKMSSTGDLHEINRAFMEVRKITRLLN
jgi:hypothetical protein